MSVVPAQFAVSVIEVVLPTELTIPQFVSAVLQIGAPTHDEVKFVPTPVTPVVPFVTEMVPAPTFDTTVKVCAHIGVISITKVSSILFISLEYRNCRSMYPSPHIGP